MILVFANPSFKSPSLEAMVSSIGNKLTRIALHKKFNKFALRFLKKIIVKLFKIHLACRLDLSVFKLFSKILICDSSYWSIHKDIAKFFPGFGGYGSQALCKLQLVIDFLKGQIHFFEITKARKNDQSYTKKFVKLVTKGTLVLADLGYYSAGFFKEIIDKSAFFISRLKYEVKLYDPETKKEIDFLKLAKKIKEDKFELNVLIQIKKTGEYLSVRLVAMKVPKAVAEQRRRKRKEREKDGRSKTKKKTLKLCDWTLMITNLSTKELPAAAMYIFYMVRWQIELIIKQLKSILQIHQCQSSNKYRVLCEIYGKLILATIITKFYGHLNAEVWEPKQKRELSIEKFFKQLQHRLNTVLSLALNRSSSEALDYLLSETQLMVRSCFKHKQQNRSSCLEKLLLPINEIFIYITKSQIKDFLS